MATRNIVRRGLNSLAMRNGETHESKLFATIGKCLCIWLVYKYAEVLINHWEVLLVLMAWLIAPDVAKKAITMRFGGDSNDKILYTKETHESQRSVSDSKDGSLKDLSRD